MKLESIILIALSLIVAIVVGFIRKKQYGYPTQQVILFTTLTCLYGVIGTKILFMIEHINLGIKLNGVSFYGAVFFIPIAMFITTKITKEDYKKAMDFFGPYILSTLGIMRIGCYLSGCCSAHRIIFMHQQIVPPIQLIEAILDLILFISLLIYHDKINKNNTGTLYPKIMIGYSFIRLIMENYRDTPKDVIGMSRGQWYSIIAFILATIAIAIINNQKTKRTNKKY